MIQQQECSSSPSFHLSCSPLAVGHDTEGLAIMLNVGEYRILLDCGLENIKSLLVDQSLPPHWVFCTHAHHDHGRGLLSLHEVYPHLPIYCSEVTKKLLPLNWLRADGSMVEPFCDSIPWRSPLQLEKNLSVELYPAGHLPGAAAVLFRYHHGDRVYKIFYTGDFCLSNLQLVEGLSLDNMRGLSPDVLIIEGTYGTARHPHRRQQEKHLMTKIREAIASNINVILPVPTFGLGQELLKLLRSHHQFTGANIDIWVDGNVAIACDLYLELIDYFPANVQNFAKHQPLFWDEKIKPRMRRLTPNINRKKIGEETSIILTDDLSKIDEYCQNNDYKWLILTPEHSKINKSKTFNQIINKLNTEKVIVENYLLAEHSDGRNTTQLIHNLRPQHVIFVHGTPNYLADLTALEELQNRYQLHCPEVNIKVDLPIGEQFIQPKISPQQNYEGELNETGAYITITLPEQLNKDSRWQNFADTGLIEARWQGEELVLRGLSQRELLQQNSSIRRQLNAESCHNCAYYDEDCCHNEKSPLNGFEVPEDGFCPAFEDNGQ
ncbi:MBL fold metallo-hydrolase [Cyanobacterium sp. HL-69]|uniref:MBL fold metallo-hydrolase n=1 Tax=Cyanobacterium sp. HL-69 TaxID=2054282 RepID=UPI00406BB9E3